MPLCCRCSRCKPALPGLIAEGAVVAVQLLGELLLDRVNVRVMMKYVSEVNNLKLMMTLLKDSSKSIQFEAFHVFKVSGGLPPICCSLIDH